MSEMRTIPACAGETHSPSPSESAHRVHPRVCGGNLERAAVPAAVGGPSPRVRGKLDPVRGGAGDGGSIPACAGETRTPSEPSPRRRVHPRVCGGNPLPASRPCSSRGPSPRVRGKRRRPHRAALLGGSIPACAGETSSTTPASPVRQVHPRVCGGNATSPRMCCEVKGPSPRVRGKRDGDGGGGHLPGSIPACAGETTRRRASPASGRVHPRVCGGNSQRAVPR